MSSSADIEVRYIEQPIHQETTHTRRDMHKLEYAPNGNDAAITSNTVGLVNVRYATVDSSVVMM